MKLDRKIIAIFVEDIGWIYADDNPIEIFFVNGEMAQVAWYKKKNEEFNGRYVETIRYYEQRVDESIKSLDA